MSFMNELSKYSRTFCRIIELFDENGIGNEPESWEIETLWNVEVIWNIQIIGILRSTFLLLVSM